MRASRHIAKNNPGGWHAAGAEGLLGSRMNNNAIPHLAGLLQV